jgi:hypothetical protein
MNPNHKSIKSLGTALSLIPDDAENVRSHWRHAFIDLMRKEEKPDTALRAAYVSREAELLRAVFKHWPNVDWNRHIVRSKFLKTGTLMRERRYAHLRALRDAGVTLSDNFHHLIQVAQAHDDPEPIHVLRRDFGWNDLIWKQDDFAFYLESCGPGLAPLMWDELLHHMNSRHGRAIRSFTKLRVTFSGLKGFAALLSTGKDIRGIYRNQMDTAHPHLIDLINKTGSKHGQLALRAMEPDPIDIVGRPSAGSFFGMPAETFFQDYPERPRP